MRLVVMVCSLLLFLTTAGALARPVVVEESSSVVPNDADRSTAQTVWFQGFLADDATGDPINASYNIVARIYNAAGGGALLWGPETHAAVTITEGWFNIELGSIVSPLPTFASPPYYLSLQVNGEYLTPRLKLASVPSALQSGTSDLLPFSGVYGGASSAFSVTQSSASSAPALSIARVGGLPNAYTVYASNDAPSTPTFRGFQNSSSSDDLANVLRADIPFPGNDSPVVDAYTAGAGPAYWGMSNGLCGLEVYADATDASDDSVAHVIHAVYDGGMRDAENVAVYGESVDSDVWGAGGMFVGSGIGVLGEALPPSTGALLYYGVLGRSDNTSAGLNVGVYGTAGNGDENYAGLFDGDVDVNGTLTKSGGSFRIDHPLDPANKYLSHSFVESPDMKNIYDGVVVLDGAGAAVVELPEWFQALNQDFRYQLTCIGAFAPVYVAGEISGNRFSIAGGEPGMRVSWQVTGIRHDPYAEAHRIPVEEVKPAREQGRYRNPALYGAPETAGVRYDARMAKQLHKAPASDSGAARRAAPAGVDPVQQ
jgi:hypothetical protein